MIETPTCLILGAGASAEYGFPTGRHLYELICTDFELGGSIYDAVSRVVRGGDLKGFVRELRGADERSIDFFLESRSEFDEIGRAAIAVALIQREKPDVLVEHWCQALWHQMAEGCASYDEFLKRNENLTILTFNYDRSVERFLDRRFRHKYGISNQSIWSRIRILHVNGSLGLYGDARDPYGPALNPGRIKRAADSLLIHVDDLDVDASGRIESWFAQAERIVFLGWGFHVENLDRLRLKTVGTSVWMGGTSLGLSKRHRQNLYEYLDRDLELRAVSADEYVRSVGI